MGFEQSTRGYDDSSKAPPRLQRQSGSANTCMLALLALIAMRGHLIFEATQVMALRYEVLGNRHHIDSSCLPQASGRHPVNGVQSPRASFCLHRGVERKHPHKERGGSSVVVTVGIHVQTLFFF